MKVNYENNGIKEKIDSIIDRSTIAITSIELTWDELNEFLSEFPDNGSRLTGSAYYEGGVCHAKSVYYRSTEIIYKRFKT